MTAVSGDSSTALTLSWATNVLVDIDVRNLTPFSLMPVITEGMTSPLRRIQRPALLGRPRARGRLGQCLGEPKGHAAHAGGRLSLCRLPVVGRSRLSRRRLPVDDLARDARLERAGGRAAGGVPDQAAHARPLASILQAADQAGALQLQPGHRRGPRLGRLVRENHQGPQAGDRQFQGLLDAGHLQGDGIAVDLGELAAEPRAVLVDGADHPRGSSLVSDRKTLLTWSSPNWVSPFSVLIRKAFESGR